MRECERPFFVHATNGRETLLYGIHVWCETRNSVCGVSWGREQQVAVWVWVGFWVT